MSASSSRDSSCSTGTSVSTSTSCTTSTSTPPSLENRRSDDCQKVCHNLYLMYNCWKAEKLLILARKNERHKRYTACCRNYSEALEALGDAIKCSIAFQEPSVRYAINCNVLRIRELLLDLSVPVVERDRRDAARALAKGLRKPPPLLLQNLDMWKFKNNNPLLRYPDEPGTSCYIPEDGPAPLSNGR